MRIPAGLRGYHSETPTRQDTTAARAALAKADYDGRQLAFLVSTTPNHSDVAQLVQADLAAVGIQTKIEVVDFNSFVTRLFGDSRPPLFLSYSEWIYSSPDLILEQFRSTAVPNPNLFGYKSYKYRIELRNVEMTRTATREIVEAFDAEMDSVSRPFEMNLFGKPGRQELEFKRLFTVEFDSEEFYELGFGRFTAAMFRDVGKRLVNALIERPPIDLSGDQAKVLAVDEAQVFLGIGSDDLVEHGDLLPLMSDTTRVALVKVDQIIGPHLSSARVLETAGEIQTGMRIGQRVDWGNREEIPDPPGVSTRPSRHPERGESAE